MYVQKIENQDELKLWIANLNDSFKHRSSKQIPYEEVLIEDIAINENNIVLGVYGENGELIGGTLISYCIEYTNVKLAKIGHVWTHIGYQKKGIGTFLMSEIEKLAWKDGRELLQLNVANIYIPAVELYKKSGFKKLLIYANVPNTYYFIRMIKPIGDYKFSEIKRLYELIKSTIKFKILYRNDSSPTMINKIVYKNK